MRTFRVTVNGEAYEVTVEEVGPGQEEATRLAAPPGPAPVAKAEPARSAQVPAPSSASRRPSLAPGVQHVLAPLPGAILTVRVKEGEAVAEGQVLCLLEAMKMENEVVAPVAGVVREVHVTPGQSVAGGDVLFGLQA